LVEQPAVQASRVIGPVLVRSTVEGTTVLVEGFDDPRVARGIFRDEIVGHSERVMETGVVYVSVPLEAGQGVDQINIRLAIASDEQIGAGDPKAVSTLFDEERSDMRVMGQIDYSALRKLPDWPNVAAALGVPAEVGRFEIYVDRGRRFRWRLRRPDGELVAASGKDYRSREACEADVRWVRTSSPRCTVVALDLNNH
jgi:uncharacterized protein YegP (UPF0339 family)